MPKRARSSQRHSHPSHSHSRPSRREASIASSSTSTLSDSVEFVGHMSEPHHTGNTSGGCPQSPRDDSEPSATGTQPTTVNPADAPMDPHLEQQMDRLGLDNDFRDSIRAMSPGTQREVLNDIIRSHNMEQERGFGAQLFGGAQEDDHGGLFHYDGDEDDDDDEEEDGENHMRNPAAGLGLLQLLLQGGSQGGGAQGFSGVRAVAVDEDGTEHEINPLQLLMQAIAGGGGMGPQRGGHVQALQTFFNNLATEAQQEEAMREMGITQDLDDMSYEQLLELEERIGSVSKGLRPGDVNACLKPLDGRPKEGACPICLESWVPSADGSTPSSAPSSMPRDEAAVELKHCHHAFHDNCIREWLKSSKQCPVCCQDVLEGTHNNAFAPT